METPQETGTGRAPFGPAAVLAAGAATLFVELALIRYIPGQVRVLGYFTNFVLLAAFLGFGLGMLLSRKHPGSDWVSHGAPLGLFGVVALTELGAVLNVLPSAEDFLFLEYQAARMTLPIIPFLTLSFATLAAGFLPLGHFVGRTLQGPDPIRRYAWNIAGSLLGIALFVLLSAAGTLPWVWMMLAGLISLVGLWGAPRRWWILGIAGTVLMVGLAAVATRGSTWSPYQKITVGPIHVLPGKGMIQEWELPGLKPEEKAGLAQLEPQDGFTIRVNDDSFQTPMDLSDSALNRHPDLKGMRIQFDLPFTLWGTCRPLLFGRATDTVPVGPPAEVLVLGAGSGNDVAAALRAGAAHVDAVEIDPEILRLGRERHPEKPYADPRVTVHLDDARNFLAGTGRQYDMIVFGLLDSHVLLSHKSNIRLDSYVFTRESFALARDHLKPDGLMIVSHAVGTEFFFDRMRTTLAAAFNKPPVIAADVVFHPIGIAYVTGRNVLWGRPLHLDHPVDLLEDDWPFVYLRSKNIPKDYLVAMLLMGLITLAAVRGVAGRGWEGLNGHFFALGAGFLLLETRGISVLMLLAGSTWGVSAAVFAGVLVMALLATAWGARIRSRIGGRLAGEYYLLLFAFLLVNFFVPVGSLAGLARPVRVAAGALLLSLPLFASGVIFALSLSRAGDAEGALASNLLGALMGGLVEYIAMATGFTYLLVPAGIFYFLALLFEARDRETASARDRTQAEPAS